VIHSESLDGREVLQNSIDVDGPHLPIGASLALDSVTIDICGKKTLRTGVFDVCSTFSWRIMILNHNEKRRQKKLKLKKEERPGDAGWPREIHIQAGGILVHDPRGVPAEGLKKILLAL